VRLRAQRGKGNFSILRLAHAAIVWKLLFTKIGPMRNGKRRL
jgi:hypothetical protein